MSRGGGQGLPGLLKTFLLFYDFDVTLIMLNFGKFCNRIIVNIWIMLQLEFSLNFPCFWKMILY